MPLSASLPSRVKVGFIRGAMNLVTPLKVKLAVWVTSCRCPRLGRDCRSLIGDRGRKPCPSGQGGSLAWSGRFWSAMLSLTMCSGAPPHDRAKYDGDQNLPRIPAWLIRPSKSCRSRRDEAPLRVRELTRWESATFGGYCTSRWTWSSSALNSARVASKSAHTCAMTCSHRWSISAPNTPRRYW